MTERVSQLVPIGISVDLLLENTSLTLDQYVVDKKICSILQHLILYILEMILNRFHKA